MRVFETMGKFRAAQALIGLRLSYGFNGLLLRCEVISRLSLSTPLTHQDLPFHLAMPDTVEPLDWAYGNYWGKSASHHRKIMTYKYSLHSLLCLTLDITCFHI